jgi:hypothetical protein
MKSYVPGASVGVIVASGWRGGETRAEPNILRTKKHDRGKPGGVPGDEREGTLNGLCDRGVSSRVAVLGVERRRGSISATGDQSVIKFPTLVVRVCKGSSTKSYRPGLSVGGVNVTSGLRGWWSVGKAEYLTHEGTKP